jgi:hypothetical protein
MMPLIQGGPPEWIWERRPEQLKWRLIPSRSLEGNRDFELRVNCGLEIMRLQFFGREEIEALQSALASGLLEMDDSANATRQLSEQHDRGQPGGGQGRVDITGVASQDSHVDPNITEGHPGYEESAESEIRPLKKPS